MLTREEIYGKVASTLVEALNLDEDEIVPDATLQGDLGAESIDFLDIIYRVEREFGIKIARGELFPESIFQGNPELVQDGRVTDKGLADLRARMPFADLSGFEKNPELSHVGDLFTVDLITRLHPEQGRRRHRSHVAGLGQQVLVRHGRRDHRTGLTRGPRQAAPPGTGLPAAFVRLDANGAQPVHTTRCMASISRGANPLPHLVVISLNGGARRAGPGET
jgi:acyl carrier protein